MGGNCDIHFAQALRMDGMSDPAIVVRPVTPARWADLEVLFGESGAYSGCWCMFHRQTSSEFSAKAGTTNRSELRSLVDRGRRPGLIAYVDRRPVGWVSVAPRGEFGRIERSPLFKSRAPSEDTPDVWSITCFFIDRSYRERGIATALLESALQYAIKRGARALEGYPLDVKHKSGWSSSETYMGTFEMFHSAGFQEVERRKPARPLMRYVV